MTKLFVLSLLGLPVLAGQLHSSLQVTGGKRLKNEAGFEITLIEIDKTHRRPHQFEIEVHVISETSIQKITCADGLENVQAPETNGRMAHLYCRPKKGAKKLSIHIIPTDAGPFEVEVVGLRINGSDVKLN